MVGRDANSDNLSDEGSHSAVDAGSRALDSAVLAYVAEEMATLRGFDEVYEAGCDQMFVHGHIAVFVVLDTAGIGR